MVNLSCGNAGMCFCAFPEQGNSTGKLQSFTGSVIYWEPLGKCRGKGQQQNGKNSIKTVLCIFSLFSLSIYSYTDPGKPARRAQDCGLLFGFGSHQVNQSPSQRKDNHLALTFLLFLQTWSWPQPLKMLGKSTFLRVRTVSPGDGRRCVIPPPGATTPSGVLEGPPPGSWRGGAPQG